jgi:hypothetical protein
MKNIVLLLTLGLSVTACAEVAPHDDQANAGIAIFQADTAQTPGHIAQCVAHAYSSQNDIKVIDLPGGGEKIVASLANGATAEVVQFLPTSQGTHVEIHQMTTDRRDPYGFVKQARVCGAMSGS